MKKEIKQYLAEIGAKGGRASRRKITAEQQAAMKAARLTKKQNDLDERARTPASETTTKPL